MMMMMMMMMDFKLVISESGELCGAGGKWALTSALRAEKKKRKGKGNGLTSERGNWNGS